MKQTTLIVHALYLLMPSMEGTMIAIWLHARNDREMSLQ